MMKPSVTVSPDATTGVNTRPSTAVVIAAAAPVSV